MHSASDSQLDQIKLAARLYYVDDQPQAEVARILAVSQAKVSRLLKAARETGVVRITVCEYAPTDPSLEEALAAQLGLRRVVVVRNIDEASMASLRRHVGYFGAPAVEEEIRSSRVVGLTGGRTLSELVRRIEGTTPVDGLQIVQLMGNIDAEVSEFDAIELSRSLAGKLGGVFYTLNSPAFASSIASRKAYLEQAQVRTIWKLYGKMDLALVGIGSLRDSAFIERRVLEPGALEALRRTGTVGEICGRFFNARGQECRCDYRDRVISIEFKALRRIPSVVGVTAGADRAEAVLAAIRGGLIKSLVIDEEGARAVLARVPERPQQSRNESRPRPRVGSR